jgi:hypothetical protein
MEIRAVISGASSAATIRLTTIRAIRTEVTAPEALTAMVVAEATAAAAFDASRRRNQRLDRPNPKTPWIDPSVNPNSVWNHFK